MNAAGADLVEISPNADPPVCRIIDYSKFLYQLKKKQKEIKAKSVKVVVKEIRFGPQTDDHDFNFKLKHAIGFLQEGAKVRAYVFFKGRSILFKEQGEVLLLRFAIRAEETLKEKGYEVSLMAGPKEISPNCGVALQFQPQYRDEVESILKEKDVLFEAVHLYTPKVEKGILKKLLGK